MKSILKAVLCVAISITAAPAFSQISVGVQGGATWASPNITAPAGLSYDSKSKTSYQAGLIFDIPFGDGGLRLMPELKYTDKKHGFSTAVTLPGQGAFNYSGTSNISYLEVPVNLAYAFGSDVKFIVGAGPYIGYGLSGKNDYTLSSGTTEISEKVDIEFGSGEGQVKRMDFGAHAMAAVLFNNGFMLKVNYGLGLTNLYSAETSGASYKQNYLGASLVYFFKR